MNELISQWLEPPPGGWKCRCGVELEFPGVCDACGEREGRRRAADRVMDRIATIPERFRWATFDSPELANRCNPAHVAKAESATRRLRSGSVQNIVFLGRAGLGKTSLACAGLRVLLGAEVGFTGRFCGVTGISDSLRDSAYGKTPESVDLAKTASLIVLDDVGQEPEKHSQTITEIIHERHNAMKPTIFTTWMSEVDLGNRYGEGTLRRILEHSAIVRLS